MSSPKRLFALAVLPVVFLAGCGDDSSKASSSGSGSGSSSASSSPSSSSSSGLASPATKGNVSDVKVDTKNAKKPTVSIAKDKLPFGTKSATTKVLSEGKGKAIGDKDLVKADFVMVNGTTGKTLGSTFGETVPSFNMADNNNLPGLLTQLKGKKEGSKVVISLPSGQAFGKAGNQNLGIGSNDNLVLYMDIKGVDTPLTEAKGTSKPAESGMPAVKVPAGAGKQAAITMPKGAKAPTSLKTSTLVEGEGDTVKSGDSIAVTYTGQIWGKNTVFDATAKHPDAPNPSVFVIGKKQVITGWDKALVGKKVGSRVLVVVPPADGYGAQGNPQAGIQPTDTLVFVVDILAAN
ncbi:FKBP-type peptidyl-prolyl cis-trans isomerase [Dermacoccus barathri]|uniref:FKBP-type peptidyl-prolyl cis-trans isomerase n=1 Tax=Dermacoccus barathri TaxID=322601 RepID=UPI001879C1EC|nr:FKBP-type peptidyl-prolyl cis-trans isomerase [Dermacoccus barathri]MBE7372412.1 FKBP-type peptidyl-prolyl cis-trans isomerase [Dermacoccus barathri]